MTTHPNEKLFERIEAIGINVSRAYTKPSNTEAALLTKLVARIETLNKAQATKKAHSALAKLSEPKGDLRHNYDAVPLAKISQL